MSEYGGYTEQVLKDILEFRLTHDFEIRHEVKGRHLIEGVTVFADMLITPRAHLIANGFDQGCIAIEVKAITNNSGRLGQVVHQAATYAQSEFDCGRPLFALIFPSFDDFAGVASSRTYLGEDVGQMIAGAVARTTSHLAQFMNVGHFEWANERTWNIKIGGQRYYSIKDGKGKTNLLKRYVGTMK